MTPGIKRVQSREVINVSQDLASDPMLGNTPPRSKLSPPLASDNSDDRVEESLIEDHAILNRHPGARDLDANKDTTTGEFVTPIRDGTRIVAKNNTRKSSLLVSHTSHGSGPVRSQQACDSNLISQQKEDRAIGIQAAQPGSKTRDLASIQGDNQAFGSDLQSSAKDTIAAVQLEEENEEDLYGATPERKTRGFSSDSGAAGKRSLIAVSSMPAAESAELKTPASHLVRADLLPQPAFKLPQTVNERSAERGIPPRVESTTSHTIVMAPGSKATPSTGKLASGSSALAKLHARKQAIQGRNAMASTKIFETASSTRDVTAGRRSHAQKSEATSGKLSKPLKAKRPMRDGIAHPQANLKVEAPSRQLRSKFIGLTGNENLQRDQRAARKRKVRPDAADIAREEPKPELSKRVKITNKAARPSPMSSSGDPQPDAVYDMPESPPKAGRGKAPKWLKKEPAAKATALVSGSTTEGNRKKIQEGTQKAATVQLDDGKRTLRSRNLGHRLPVEDGQSEGDESDRAEDTAKLVQAQGIKEESPHTRNFVQQDKRITARRLESSQNQRHADDSETEARYAPRAAPIENDVALLQQPAPLGSQHNAILLSDQSELSSSVDRDSPAPEMVQKSPARRETPADVNSSPRVAVPRAGPHSLYESGRSRKAQIISFSKTGPLNQGSAPKSEFSRPYITPTIVAVNWELEANHSFHPARKKPSSVTTSVRSGKSNHAAPPSNVARDVHDALAGLSKKGFTAATGTDTVANTVRAPIANHVEQNVSNIDHDSIDSEENDGRFSTLHGMESVVNSPAPGPQLYTELENIPTASQIAMPPPSRKAQSPLVATRAVKNTISTAAPSDHVSSSVPLLSNLALPSHAGPSGAANSSKAAECGARTETGKPNAKRSIPIKVSPERSSKRTKTSSAKGAPAAVHGARVEEIFTKKSVKQFDGEVPVAVGAEVAVVRRPAKQTKVTSSKPAKARGCTPSATDVITEQLVDRTIASRSTKDPAVPNEMPKPKQYYKTNTISSDVRETLPNDAVQPRRVWHAQRKQSRHWSQNSQTVDLNGSPVPPDMDIKETSTVLETFSQQADDLSRANEHSFAILRKTTDCADIVHEDASSSPPSSQPPSLLSNTKVVPGPSESTSKPMLHIKVAGVDAKRLMHEEMPPIAALYPFASLGKSSGMVVPVKHKVHPLERREDFAQHISNPGKPFVSQQAHGQGSASCLRLQSSPAEHVATNTGEPSAGPPNVADKFASALDKQVMILRENTAFARAAGEDPDKTLVDYCSQATEASKDSSAAPSPGAPAVTVAGMVDKPESIPESSEDDPDASDDSADPDDLRKWRRGLKPHQLGLYEELVKIARVVTEYVTGQETAAEIMIDDNYQRELIMIEQEETIRKRQYKQYVANLQRNKSERIQEMQKLEKVLQDVLNVSATAWEEHREGRAEKERADRKVDELIASLS